jgi:D-tyrosyl-tRNA(Tyr) deacylase
MRAVIQRVTQASVSIDGQEKAKINHGLLVLLGIEEQDNQEDIDWLCRKIAQLRIFDDLEGVMNLSIQDIEGEIMVISQFTLHAKVKKGNRPSYIKAARPETAIPLYEKFIRTISTYIEHKIQTGEFGAVMQVSLTNDGPVTIIIDTKNRE